MVQKEAVEVQDVEMEQKMEKKAMGARGASLGADAAGLMQPPSRGLTLTCVSMNSGHFRLVVYMGVACHLLSPQPAAL